MLLIAKGASACYLWFGVRRQDEHKLTLPDTRLWIGATLHFTVDGKIVFDSLAGRRRGQTSISRSCTVLDGEFLYIIQEVIRQRLSFRARLLDTTLGNV